MLCTCSKSGQFEKAVSIYGLLPSVELFHDFCQLGLAAYKAGSLEQSFQGELFVKVKYHCYQRPHTTVFIWL